MEKPSQSSTRKKVILHQVDGAVVKGYVESGCLVGPHGAEVLDRDGHLITVPLEDIKKVYFVRDFEGDTNRPERKVFSSRPRMSGIWIRMVFKDSEVAEGLMANDLLETEPFGFMVTPPDFYSNNLRVFVPRAALQAVEVLGVISDESARRRTGHRTRRAGPKPAEESPQIGLFPPPGDSPAK